MVAWRRKLIPVHSLRQRKGTYRIILLLRVLFCFVSFRFVPFRSVSFRFVSIAFVNINIIIITDVRIDIIILLSYSFLSFVSFLSHLLFDYTCRCFGLVLRFGASVRYCFCFDDPI